MRWLDAITNAMGRNLGKLWEMVRNREAWHAAVHAVAKSWTKSRNYRVHRQPLLKPKCPRAHAVQEKPPQ